MENHRVSTFLFFDKIILEVFELKKGQTKRIWTKEQMKIDFNLKSAESIPSFIENYVYYFNNERLSYKLNYKTPVQYRTEQGFG